MLDRDVMNVARPDQERIRRVRCALIAMATAFDDETQVVFAGKVHRSSDVGSISCGDSKHAGSGRPSVYPAQGLGYAGTIADVVGILQVLEHTLGFCLRLAHSQGRLNRARVTCFVPYIPPSMPHS